MNLSEVKETVKRIILHISEQIEWSGMDGDIDAAAYNQEELEMFLEAQKELDNLHNTDIIPHYLPKIFAEHVPSLRIDSFWGYVDTLARRAEDQIADLQKDITLYRILADHIRAEALELTAKRVEEFKLKNQTPTGFPAAKDGVEREG